VLTPILLILLLITPILEKKFSVKGRYYIWLLMAVLLILPLTLVLPGHAVEINLPIGNVQSYIAQESIIQNPANTTQTGDSNQNYPPDIQSTHGTQQHTQQLLDVSAHEQPPQQQQVQPPQISQAVTQGEISHAETTQITGQSSQPPNMLPSEQNPRLIPHIITDNIQNIALITWLFGVIISATLHIKSYVSLNKYIKCWSEAVTEKKTLTIFQNEASNLNIKKHVELITCKGINAPMLIGFIRPTVVLADHEYTGEDLCLILKHELTHMSRKDLIYKLVMVLAKCIHWFNPTVHLMAKQANKDLEVRCDEIIVENMPIETKKSYSELLLFIASGAKKSRCELTTCMSEDKKTLKTRLGNILGKGKKRGAMTFATLAVGIAILTLTVGVNISGCSGENNEIDDITQEDTTATQHQPHPIEAITVSHNDVIYLDVFQVFPGNQVWANGAMQTVPSDLILPVNPQPVGSLAEYSQGSPSQIRLGFEVLEVRTFGNIIDVIFTLNDYGANLLIGEVIAFTSITLPGTQGATTSNIAVTMDRDESDSILTMKARFFKAPFGVTQLIQDGSVEFTVRAVRVNLFRGEAPVNIDLTELLVQEPADIINGNPVLMPNYAPMEISIADIPELPSLELSNIGFINGRLHIQIPRFYEVRPETGEVGVELRDSQGQFVPSERIGWTNVQFLGGEFIPGMRASQYWEYIIDVDMENLEDYTLYVNFLNINTGIQLINLSAVFDVQGSDIKRSFDEKIIIRGDGKAFNNLELFPSALVLHWAEPGIAIDESIYLPWQLVADEPAPDYFIAYLNDGTSKEITFYRGIFDTMESYSSFGHFSPIIDPREVAAIALNGVLFNLT